MVRRIIYYKKNTNKWYLVKNRFNDSCSHFVKLSVGMLSVVPESPALQNKNKGFEADNWFDFTHPSLARGDFMWNYVCQKESNPILDTRISSVLLLLLLRHAQGTPPRILQRAGLESSGRIASSSFGKTKRIAYFCGDFFLLLF